MDKIAELKKINELLQSGALDKDEFELLKGKILGVPLAEEAQDEPVAAPPEEEPVPEPPVEETAEMPPEIPVPQPPEEDAAEMPPEIPVPQPPVEETVEVAPEEPVPASAQQQPAATASKEPGKKRSKAPLIIGLIILVLGSAFGVVYWFAFRTMENEKFITINAIKMRKYSDTDSEVIGKYSFKTRFRIVEEKSEPDPKDRYWAKVEVIGSMGWLNSTTGWMVIRQGTIDWAMSETDCLLMEQLLGNEEAHKRLGSKYRNSLLYHFKNNPNLTPDWMCYMQPTEEENQLAAYASFGISANDKDDKSQGSFVCIIQNKEESLRKLLVFSYNEHKEPSIEYESECNGCYALNVFPKGEKATYGVNENSFVPNSDVVEAKHINGRYLLHFDNNQFASLDD